MRPRNCATRYDKKQKLGIYKFYDFTKGGTDIVDQPNDYYTVCSQSNRWDLVAFYYILSIIRVSFKTLFCIKKGEERKKKENTFDLAFELAKSLTYPFIEQRRTNGLGKSITRKNDFVLNRQSTPPIVSKIERRFPYSSYKGMCFLCVEKCNIKKEKDNASCSKEDCQSCGKTCINMHCVFVSIVITMQINFLETLDLEIYQ